MPTQAADDDKDLLARLNALKPSSISLDRQDLSTGLKNTTEKEETVDGLTARFQKLKTTTRSTDPQTSLPCDTSLSDAHRNSEDSEDFEELVKQLANSDAFTMSEDEEQQIDELLKQANDALEGSREPSRSRDVSRDKDESKQGESEADVGHSNAALWDSQAANEYVQNALSGANIETAENSPRRSRLDDTKSDAAGLDLPSAPTTAPQNIEKGGQTTQRRLSKYDLSNYTDAEIETWCTICNDDATLMCKGCDDDLYCTRCWQEGHRVDSAGQEERSHKAIAFTKDGSAIAKTYNATSVT